MVFHWSLSDSKSPQVSRTRLRILAVLSNAVVWIVSTRPPTSKSSRPFNNPFVIVPNAQSLLSWSTAFFNSLARSRYLSFFSLSFRFILWFAGTAKSKILEILFLLLIIMTRVQTWTRLIAFHIALIPLGKVWIQLFSLQLWVNSRTDLVLQP